MHHHTALTEDGNGILQYFEVTRHVGSFGPQLAWKVYDAYRRQDKQEASVFVFEKRIAEKLHKPKRKEMVTEVLRRSVRQLEKMQHTNSKILLLYHPLEESNNLLAFASERVMCSLANIMGNCERMPSPIPAYIKEYDFLEIEVKYGILQIVEALSYLHITDQMLHNDVSPQSILITKKGTWKLANMAFVQKASKDGKDVFQSIPWSSKLSKMAQPDLDYMAPEIQTKQYCTSAADMFSLGMSVLALYNQGRSLIEAQYTPSLYLKRVEQIKYFSDTGVACLQYLDVLEQKDNQQKSEFFAQLPKSLHLIPKKLIYQHVFPTISSEIKVYDLMGSSLYPILHVLDVSTEEEYYEYVRPVLWSIFSLPKSVMAWQVLLERLDILLKKVSPNEVRTDVVPLVVNALDHVSPTVQDVSLCSINLIQQYIDDETITKNILPRAKSTFLRSNNLKFQVNALFCIDKLLDRLDKMIILDEVIPFLIEIQCQDAAIIMAVASIYKHMLEDRKFGLSPGLIATKVMPILLPSVVQPSLNMDQFSMLMDILREMIDNIEKSHKGKIKVNSDADQNYLGLPDQDRPPHLRHRRSMTDAPVLQIEGRGVEENDFTTDDEEQLELPTNLLRHRHSTTDMPSVQLESDKDSYNVDKDSLLPPGLNYLMKQNRRSSVVDNNKTISIASDWMQKAAIRQQRHSVIEAPNLKDIFGSLAQSDKERAREERKQMMMARYGFESKSGSGSTPSTPNRQRRASCVPGLTASTTTLSMTQSKQAAGGTGIQNLGSQMMNFLSGKQ